MKRATPWWGAPTDIWKDTLPPGQVTIDATQQKPPSSGPAIEVPRRGGAEPQVISLSPEEAAALNVGKKKAHLIPLVGIFFFALAGLGAYFFLPGKPQATVSPPPNSPEIAPAPIKATPEVPTETEEPKPTPVEPVETKVEVPVQKKSAPAPTKAPRVQQQLADPPWTGPERSRTNPRPYRIDTDLDRDSSRPFTRGK